MKYSNEQNARHFLAALQNQLTISQTVAKPIDCPLSRWASINREAKRSLPSFVLTVSEMMRKPYGVNKRVTFNWTEDR